MRNTAFANEASSGARSEAVPLWAEKFLFRQQLLDIYARAQQQDSSSLLQGLLEEMRIDLRVDPEDLAKVPAKGAVVVVANHPFGILDGIALGAALLRVRPDVRIITNFLLAGLSKLHQHCIFVDPFNRSVSRQANAARLKQAISHLRAGGALVTFPAGEVSYWQFEHGEVIDPVWNETCSRMARLANAAVVPVLFLGRNSIPYHALGMIHPLLRTIQLPQQFINKAGQSVEVRIGAPISAERIRRISSDRRATEYLRWRTYLLRRRGECPAPAPAGRFFLPLQRRQASIALPGDRRLIAADVQQLEGQQLEENREFSVFVADAAQIPNLLLEIGRLRELTFRAAGEGTGQERDLDRFDQHYKHLILWGKEKQEVAGAYRFANTQETIADKGISGLYTSVLFHYNPILFSEMGPALELGRSFVQPEYQKQYAPLMMLWKGIARYVATHPCTPILFGAVSISNEYNKASRELLFQFFQSRCPHPLTQWVRPRRPFRPRSLRKWELEAIQNTLDAEEVSTSIAEIERDGKGIPILLRQYLKLGGEVLAFNLDKSFADALDGLILVDLRKTDPARLTSYMGKDNAAAFRSYHQQVIEQKTAVAPVKTP